MSEVTLENPGFDLPEKPADATHLVRLVECALDETVKLIKLTDRSRNYTPERAIKKGAGNCFAQAIACVAILNHWDANCGVVYDGAHASVVASEQKNVIFGDPKHSTKKAPELEAGWNANLSRLYRRTLPKDLASGNFVRYFFTRQSGNQSFATWQTALRTSVRSGLDLNLGASRARVITDARTGVEMLTSIGDLRTFDAIKSPRYIDEYPNLIQFVPDFIELPEPSEI